MARGVFDSLLDEMPYAMGYTLIAVPVCLATLTLGMMLGFYGGIAMIAMLTSKPIKINEYNSVVATFFGVPIGIVFGSIIGALLSKFLFRRSRWGRRERITSQIENMPFFLEGSSLEDQD